jgi:hypothetical protein
MFRINADQCLRMLGYSDRVFFSLLVSYRHVLSLYALAVNPPAVAICAFRSNLVDSQLASPIRAARFLVILLLCSCSDVAGGRGPAVVAGKNLILSFPPNSCCYDYTLIRLRVLVARRVHNPYIYL